MKKYESILKRVEQEEYKLGVSYAKTDGKLYNAMRILNLLGVIYLALVDLLVIISTAMNTAAGSSSRAFTDQTLVLIAVSTALEIAAVVLNKTKLKITGGILGIAPVPYLTYTYIKSCYSFGEGFLNLKTIFYTRHLPSLLAIAATSLVMLYIASRQKIKTNRSYKRILTNLYENYANERKRENLDVNNAEWEKFISEYNPKNGN